MPGGYGGCRELGAMGFRGEYGGLQAELKGAAGELEGCGNYGAIGVL